MKRPSVLAKLALPILVCAALVYGFSLWRWYRSRSIRRHFDRAEAFVRLKKGPDAEAEWKALLREDPRNAAAYELLGEYYISRQDWTAGAGAFCALARVAPGKPHVQCRLAACLLRMDDQKDAFQTAEAELKRDPNCVAALGLLTSLMAQRPNTEPKRHLEYLRRLAKLLPDDLTVLRSYAETLTNEYLYDELRPVLARILRLNPNDVQALNLRGLADLARTDQPQGARDAIATYQTSLRLASNNPGAQFGLGRAYLGTGEPRKAVAALEEAARGLPNVARVHKQLADAYRAANQPEKARQARARFLELQRMGADERRLTVRCIAYPADPRYPRQLGELYLRLGVPNRAAFYLRKANEIKPADPGLHALLARAQAAARMTASAAGVVR
jgi:predicted Zn-dependent protease